MNENVFLGRLSLAVESAGGRGKVAKVAGVTGRTIGNYLSGQTHPSASFLEALSLASGFRAEWILSGTGPRFMGAPGHQAEQPRAGYVYLPLYDVSASAGGGQIADEENVVDVLAFKEDWIRRELRARPSDLNLIYVEGDSMEPDLRSGDIVLLGHTDTQARREGVYVVRMDGALLVKQLQRLPGGVVKVISRNPHYEPFTVPLQALETPNGFAVIGRVVWACRRF